MDNRFTAIMVAAIVVVAVIAFVVGYYINKPEAPPAEEKIKIAFIFPGDVGDTSWNEAGYVAMNIFVGRHPDIEYTWIQGVYDPAQIRPQVEDYVTQGYNLIVGFGFQFEKPMYDVAQNLSEGQDVYFLVVAGPGSYKHPRLAVADVRTDQTGYICGYIMMQLTQTGHVGFVAGMDVAELHRSWIGQRKGIQDAGYNPDEVYHVAFVGDFHDVTKSSLLTYELIDTYGVDVLKTMGDGAQLGGIAAAKARHIKVLMSETYHPEIYPDGVVLYEIWHWEIAYEEWYQDYLAGRLGSETGHVYWLKLENNGITLEKGAISGDLWNTVLDLESEIKAGQIDTGFTE